MRTVFPDIQTWARRGKTSISNGASSSFGAFDAYEESMGVKTLCDAFGEVALEAVLRDFYQPALVGCLSSTNAAWQYESRHINLCWGIISGKGDGKNYRMCTSYCNTWYSEDDESSDSDLQNASVPNRPITVMDGVMESLS
ncbi:hypothetical protein GN244_ATG02212 [Phytophthora infestans]|uniref:Uncharacterized protein n=1 Tax=Phytophthora infestans TaxID=4787 RepID=A0A833T199_PHYIN|nr:hypothetical protein GN244_ATG02212 [Phytophthora infestans]